MSAQYWLIDVSRLSVPDRHELFEEIDRLSFMASWNKNYTEIQFFWDMKQGVESVVTIPKECTIFRQS